MKTSKLNKTKLNIIKTQLLYQATSRGSSEVFRVRKIQDAKDTIRKKYGSSVIRSVIFGIPHKDKEDFLSELKSVESKYPKPESDYLTEIMEQK